MRRLFRISLMTLMIIGLLSSLAFAKENFVYVGESDKGKFYVDRESVQSYQDDEQNIVVTGKVWIRVSEAGKQEMPPGTEVIIWEQSFKNVGDDVYMKLSQAWFLDEKANLIKKMKLKGDFEPLKPGTISQKIGLTIVNIAIEKIK